MFAPSAVPAHRIVNAALAVQGDRLGSSLDDAGLWRYDLWRMVFSGGPLAGALLIFTHGYLPSAPRRWYFSLVLKASSLPKQLDLQGHRERAARIF